MMTVTALSCAQAGTFTASTSQPIAAALITVTLLAAGWVIEEKNSLLSISINFGSLSLSYAPTQR